VKIFIIGGAGYIGSHMVKIAHMAGHEVFTLDNLSTGHQDAVLYGKFEFCDILDTLELDRLFKKYKPDAVIHFSAFSLVGESVTDPYKYYHNKKNRITGSIKHPIEWLLLTFTIFGITPTAVDVIKINNPSQDEK